MSTGSTFTSAKASVLILQREGMLIEQKNGTSSSWGALRNRRQVRIDPPANRLGIIWSLVKESSFLPEQPAERCNGYGADSIVPWRNYR